jgi:hypothetical protein
VQFFKSFTKVDVFFDKGQFFADGGPSTLKRLKGYKKIKNRLKTVNTFQHGRAQSSEFSKFSYQINGTNLNELYGKISYQLTVINYL